MNLNVQEFVVLLLAVLRRRWLIILLPILVFVGLSVVAAKTWPKTYIAETLIMLQEGQAADPLSVGGGARRGAKLRSGALDTLLKSERVLRGAILDFNLGRELTPREFEDQIKDLRKQIFVGVVGQDFIQIELRQPDREGIANRLSIIVTRFLERLFSRQDAIKTARQFALETRKRDLELSEQALIDWFQRHGSLASKEVLQINAMRKRRTENEKKLLEEASATIQGPIELANILSALAQSRQLSLGRDPDSQPSDSMARLRKLFSDYDTVNKAIVELLRGVVTSALEASNEGATKYADLQGLFGRYDEALDRCASHRAQAKKSPTVPPFGLLNADLIRIIDEPKDPVSPSTSVLKIILACWVAGIGLGIGLAAVIEQIDDTIYDPRILSHLSHVDLVIEMPRLDPKSQEFDKALVPPS